MDDFAGLVIRSRSCRRVVQSRRLEQQTLVDLVDLARLVPSGGNRQPLRYLIVHAEAACAAVFPHLRWAALLTDWHGPAEGERPAAYVLVLSRAADGGLPQCDAGIAMQTLLLAAAEQGIGGCMIGSVDKAKIVAACQVPPGYDLLYAVALGHPAEQRVLEEAKAGDIGYYRDAAGVLHVPKRPLGEVLLKTV